MSSHSPRHRGFPATIRRAGCGAAALLLAAAIGAPARAQQADGGAPANLPPLRGDVEDPADLPKVQPDGTLRPALGEGAVDPTTPFSAPPANSDDQPSDATQQRFIFPKGTAKTKDRVKVLPKGPPPLPTLEAYRTAVRQRGPGVSLDTSGTQVNAAPIVPGPSVAALPAPLPKLRTKLIDDGYAPLGYDIGSLRLTPYVAQSFGYDSNPDQTQAGVKPSAYSRTEGGLGLVSQWSTNELRADLRGGYNDYFSDPGASRPDATGTIDLRLDATRDLTIDAEQRFSIDTQRPGSPELNVNTVSRPLIIGFGTTLGGTQNFGRFSLGLHGLFDRVAYDNAMLSDGTIEDLANDNYNDYGLRLRAAYELTPVVKPYVDVLVDQRIHDATVDLSGFRRDSTGVIGQLGSTFELTRLVSGDLSAGYGNRTYEDPRLKALDGPVVNGSISYAVTPLTVLSVKAATTFDETTVAGASGSQSRTVSFDVTHQLLRNLTLSGDVTYFNTRYVGAPIIENTLSETLKAEYHLSRSLVATASYEHQKLDSTSPGSSFRQDIFLVGLRLQR